MALPSFARRTLSRGHVSLDDYEYCASVDFLDVHSCLCMVVEDSLSFVARRMSSILAMAESPWKASIATLEMLERKSYY